MNWSASVLTGLTSDTEPTILLTFHNAKYIFNAGENTNRAFLQSRYNWKKTRGVFLSSLGTQRASGLPGLLMTFADAGVGRVDVTGPVGLTHYLASTRLYAFRDTLAVNPVEVLPATPTVEPVYKDENISVYAVPITSSSLETETDNAPPSALPRASKRKRTPSPIASSKRPTHDHPAASPRGGPAGILETIRLKGLSPAELEGELAREWRRHMVRETFSGVHAPKKPPRGRTGNAGIGPSVKPREHNSDAPGPSSTGGGTIELGGRDTKAALGFFHPLPRLEPPLAQARDHRMTTCLAYAVVGPLLRGKFSEERAKALGLPDGQIRSRLARGETVSFTVDDGQGGKVERTVRPEDCISKSDGRGVFLVLDTPTRSHIPALLASFSAGSFLAQFRAKDSKAGENVHQYAMRTVFHLCGDGVLEDPGYRTFMDGFGSDVHHVVASREHNSDPVTFTSAAFNTLRLHQLDSAMFPLPHFHLKPATDLATLHGMPANTLPMLANTTVEFRPYRPPALEEDPSGLDRFHPVIQPSLSLSLPGTTLAKFAEAKARVEEAHKGLDHDRPSAGDDVTVVPLGTGSALPSKYRNVSGTLLQIPGWGNVLLDAGEGTWGQLVRHFGGDGVRLVLEELKCIFISHIHADHHMGLAKILSMRRRLHPPLDHPIYLIAHDTVFLSLHEYCELEDLGFNDPLSNGVVPILSDVLHWKRARGRSGWDGNSSVVESVPWLNARASSEAVSALCGALGLASIVTVDVRHRMRCFGLVLQHMEGWRIVFSGDTMPSSTLIREGANPTLLIHEATMADDQVEMAHAKAHSTFGQAVQVAASMNAENVLLTHFSARYPKMPPHISETSEGAQQRGPTLGLAFDQARVRIGDMRKLELYLPAIKQSFLDTAEEGDEDADNSIARVVEVDIA